MITDNDSIKMVFGFKVKYLRLKKDLSYQELADRTGLSTSYLHDIEKGRKYPKIDKIMALAQALGVSYDELVSTRSTKKLQPVIDLLTSDLIREFPLELFGISPEALFDLFSNTPDKVNAFVSTIVKITRNYQMQREHLFMAALRSYQDMFDNYFEELELAVRKFKKENQIKGTLPYSTPFLESILEQRFGIRTDREKMGQLKDLEKQRSYFSPGRKTLFLNRGLTPAQENFLLGRELAFQFLNLKERPLLTRLLVASSFDELLNNFKASYFSVALLMDEAEMVKDIKKMAQRKQWNADQFLGYLSKYNVTPEMFLQRMTNILPRHFGIKDLFFLRLAGEQDFQHFRMTKELHLSQLHSPYATQLNEHYCRRWVSVNIIKKLSALRQLDNVSGPIADAQISHYWETPNQYLCLSIAKPENGGRGVSVTVGLLVNERLRELFRFLDDPNLNRRTVNITCERCSLSNCEARVAPPVVTEQLNKLQRIQEAVEKLH